MTYGLPVRVSRRMPASELDIARTAHVLIRQHDQHGFEAAAVTALG